MPPAANIDPSSFAALCDSADTVLASQPPRASGSVLRARRRALFGLQLPTSSAGNVFLDLYSADGLSITFRSLDDFRRVAGADVARLARLSPAEVTFPQTVELNFAWCIGAPGQQRDVHFAYALYTQLMATPSTSRLQPGPDDLLACAFTRLCRRLTPEYAVDFAVNRALREISTTPIFKHPKVLMMPIKRQRTHPNGDVEQAWWPWQVCTNCIAVRAKGHCSQWHNALSSRATQQPLQVYMVKPGRRSPLDAPYAWFTDVYEQFMGKDLGYYFSWERRDGVKGPMADA